MRRYLAFLVPSITTARAFPLTTTTALRGVTPRKAIFCFGRSKFYSGLLHNDETRKSYCLSARPNAVHFTEKHIIESNALCLKKYYHQDGNGKLNHIYSTPSSSSPSPSSPSPATHLSSSLSSSKHILINNNLTGLNDRYKSKRSVSRFVSKLRWNGLFGVSAKPSTLNETSTLLSIPSLSYSSNQDEKENVKRYMNSSDSDHAKDNINGNIQNDDSDHVNNRNNNNIGANAVFRALVGNSIITTLKFVCYAFTGSAAVLAEGLHTLVDSLNQAILYFGVHQATRAPDSDHPYGYGRASYFWSLVSAMGIFWMGCCVTCYHGLISLVHCPDVIHYGWETAAVLGISFVIDGYVFLSVLRDIRKTKPHDVSLFQYVKSLKDPFVMAVILEDLAACTGVIIAAGGILATYLTGIVAFDGLASILIGGLLGGISVMLVSVNQKFLIGKSIDDETEASIRQILLSRPSIEALYHVQSQWVGPHSFTIKAEIDFNGSYFAIKLREMGYEDLFLSLPTGDRKMLTKLLDYYTEDVTRMVEREIDDIETAIKEKHPDALYIELEPSSTLTHVQIKKYAHPSAKLSHIITGTTKKPLLLAPPPPPTASAGQSASSTAGKQQE